jgi:hypothetical protein
MLTITPGSGELSVESLTTPVTFAAKEEIEIMERTKDNKYLYILGNLLVQNNLVYVTESCP